MSILVKIKFREASSQNTTIVSFENPNSTTLQHLVEKAMQQLAIPVDKVSSFVVKYRGNLLSLENAFRFSGLQANSTVDLFLTWKEEEKRTKSTEEEPMKHKKKGEEEEDRVDVKKVKEVVEEENEAGATTKTSEQYISDIRNELWDEDAMVVLPTLLKIIFNLYVYPSEEKYKRIKVKTCQEKLKNSAACLALLHFIGFQQQESELVLQQCDSKQLRRLYEKLNSLCVDLDVKNIPALREPEVVLVNKDSKAAAFEFDPFKTNVLSSATSLPNYHDNNHLSPVEVQLQNLKLKRDEIMAGISIPSDRKVAVVKGRETFNFKAFNKQDEEEEEEEEGSDMGVALQHQKSVSDKIEKQSKFQTKAMREKELLEKSVIYPLCLIRVVFPSKAFVAQALFSPLESIQSVFVLLQEKVLLGEQASFSLLLPPNKKYTKQSNVSLLGEGLQPAAVLYLVWDGESRGEVNQALVVDESEFVKECIPKGVRVNDKLTTNASAQSERKNKSDNNNKGAPKWLKL